MTLAILVDVLKELVAREVFALPDDAGQMTVLKPDRVVDLALALKTKRHLRARDVDVLVVQGRDAVASISFAYSSLPTPMCVCSMRLTMVATTSAGEERAVQGLP